MMQAFESGKPFDASSSDGLTSHALIGESLGKPCRIQQLSWIDLGAVLLSCVASIIALLAVFNRYTAIAIGQTNQLVVLGLMLSVMGFCTQRQVQKLTLLCEVRFGASTLQNLDAILRSDCFVAMTSWQPRSALLFLVLLPLGLSISYKNFAGGATERVIPAAEMEFGATAAPGLQLIGNGLSLLVNVYLPFWTHPALGRTYGFNLHVLDNSTAAILDAPRPTDLTHLQSSLENDQSVIITANVSAIVTENLTPSPTERNDEGNWNRTRKSYGPSGVSEDPGIDSIHEGMWAGQDQGSNWTQIYLSRWKTKNDETFESQAERFITTRRTCTGTWNITHTNATLIGVTNLQNGDEALAQNDQAQAVIRNDSLSIGIMFFQFLGEYDWTSRQKWDQPLPDSSFQNPKFLPSVNTRTPLVASMMWARIVSLNGPERPPNDRFHLAYQRSPDEIKMVKRVPTLKRSLWLVAVLVIQPIFAVLATLGKSLLFGTPLTDDFGVVSLLAGTRDECAKKLRGAALSGRLSKKVRINFVADTEESVYGCNRLRLDLDGHGKSDTLNKRALYG